MVVFTASSRPLLLSLVMIAMVTVTPTPIIQAPWGTIEGMEVEGDDGRKMDGYLGIPFALPPVGDLRFEKPVPHPGLGEGEVFVADVIMPACIQMKGILVAATREYNEDCLKLNVFVPTEGTNHDALYPVMFFIHGGAFVMGDATTYRPSKLVADGKVIVVVIQYRLGPFGFISTGDDTLLGNQGLWDQNMALHWVKDNIRAFGGDPDLVTVFGISAGSMSTGIHMISPHSSKLMKRAIMQSGSPDLITSLASLFDASAVFRQIADLFQCQGDTNSELLQCLKVQEADDLVNRTAGLGQQSPLLSFFFPTMDGEFIPCDMKELVHDERYVQDNNIGDIDVISGVNNREGSVVMTMLMASNVSLETMTSPKVFEVFLDTCVSVLAGVRHPRAKDIAKKAVEFFYRGADSFTNRTMDVQEVVDLYGDCMFIAPAVDWARRLATMTHTSNHYLYVVDHDFHFNSQGLIQGSHHGDDGFLEFDNTIDSMGDTTFKATNKTVLNEEDLLLADKFVHIVTTFARTGNPSPPVRDDLGGDWPQFTTENNAYLSVSRSMQVQEGLGPYRDRTALWTKLVPELETTVVQDGTAQTGEDKVPRAEKDQTAQAEKNEKVREEKDEF